MEFITLSTGSTTMSRRADLHPETMELVAQMLSGAPAPSGLRLSPLIRAPGARMFDVLAPIGAVSHCLLCLSPDASERLWAQAEPMAPASVVLHRPRGTPWLAAALHPRALQLDRDLLLALPWLEAAAAWCLIAQSSGP